MSLKKLVAKIEAENELFNSMSKAEKRVKIAEDCLERIKQKTYTPRTGSFIWYETRDVFKALNEDIQSSVNSSVQCQACAKGGLFLSYVGRVNNFNACDLEDRNRIFDNEHTKLLEVFTARQLSLIEYAFENEQHLRRDINDNEISFKQNVIAKAKKYYYDYKESTPRMVAICENIIKNKGTFRP